jgi:hypothetical protein
MGQPGALRLPQAKTIAMVIGNSAGERFWIGVVQQELKPLIEKNKIELIFYNERPFEAILKEVASLAPHSAIFFQQMMVDGAGAVYGILVNVEWPRRLSVQFMADFSAPCHPRLEILAIRMNDQNSFRLSGSLARLRLGGSPAN